MAINSFSSKIFSESKKFEGLNDKVEPWYGTRYSLEKITACAIQNTCERLMGETKLPLH
ncbi:hypothetical protein JHK85_040288 [Glycine max]|nr:hypothetical protein JHK85_040288 [Glycine max]